MKRILVLCLASAGLAAAPFTEASAHETAPQRVVVPVNGTPAVLPATVRINETVVVRRRSHHRRYRTVRRTVIRNGHRTTVVRRVYY